MRDKKNKVINLIFQHTFSLACQCLSSAPSHRCMIDQPRGLQQSVVVATIAVAHIALMTFVFMVWTRLCCRRFTVMRHMTEQFDCIPTTSSLNAGSSTKQNGSRSSVTKFSTSASSLAWDMLVDFAQSSFGCFVGFASDVAGSFRLPDTSSV